MSNIEVVQTMPQGEGEEVEIYFIPNKKQLSSDQLEKEVENIGLKLVDPIALAALNEAEPEFAREYPNITQWRDENGKACFISFSNRSRDDRPCMAVNLNVNDYGRSWFSGCVRK